jgi:hypothetical protein
MENPGNSRSSSGFTIVEIVIALAILATAVVTLLGLNAAILSGTNRSEERLRSTLLLRRILSAIEFEPPGELPFSARGDVSEVLRALKSQGSLIEREDLSYPCEVEIKRWEIAGLPISDLWRAEARVVWGPNPTDTLAIDYIFRKD